MANTILALVTGSSSGIGFELAKLFADDWYDLVVAAEDDAIHAGSDKLATAGVEVPSRLTCATPRTPNASRHRRCRRRWDWPTACCRTL